MVSGNIYTRWNIKWTIQLSVGTFTNSSKRIKQMHRYVTVSKDRLDLTCVKCNILGNIPTGWYLAAIYIGVSESFL